MKYKRMQFGAMFAVMLVMLAAIAVPVAMAETNTGAIKGGECGTCPTCSPPKPIDKAEHDKIIGSISKDINIPEKYDLLSAPDNTGFVLVYKTSATSMNAVDISPSYEVREIWNATFSPPMQGSKSLVLTSNKGREVSLTFTSDPSSNTGQITAYDSLSGTITTTSVGCYQICMGSCGTVLGRSAVWACGVICSALIPTGIGYAVCVLACYAILGGSVVVDCDGICDYIC